MAAITKIDSNSSGLRYCQETSLGVLPAAASQIWYPLEPNTYASFGGKVTTIARNPINASRQRKKGVVTDVDASAGWNTDITQSNCDLLQGFLFANWRRKIEISPTQATASTHKYHVATSGLSIGSLIFVSGFTNGTNNGLKRVTAVDATDVTVVDTLIDETTTASIVEVGFQFASGDATVSTAATLPAIVTSSKDCTAFNLVGGEFIFVGDSANAAYSFAVAADNGFARVRSVTATHIYLDKSAGTLATDAGTSKTVRIFFGRVLKNELGNSIVRRSYTEERLLGANNSADITLQQADYVHGAVANKLTLNVPTANKLNMDLDFVGLYSAAIDENVSGTNTLLSKAAVVAGSAANAPAIVESDAFNTSSDVTRIKLSTFTEGTTNPTSLFAYVSDLKLTIDNKLSPDKAVGTVGAFEVSAGTFEVGGTITAYFGDVASITAVQNNADITLDAHFVKANQGISFDVPLITLGNGLPNVVQDKAIELPLDTLAATGAKLNSALDHTLLFSFWDYLPNSAE